MIDTELSTRYNYPDFVPAKFRPWVNFQASPKLGELAPDFPLWNLDGSETRLSAIWSRYTHTIVEFGSIT